MSKEAFTCPCCGYMVFGGPPGTDDICPICYWHDDASSLRFWGIAEGPNDVSLVAAQENYRQFGAMDWRYVGHVRVPRPSEGRDPAWRPIDTSIDTPPDPDSEEARCWPDDLEELYYWRRH